MSVLEVTSLLKVCLEGGLLNQGWGKRTEYRTPFSVPQNTALKC